MPICTLLRIDTCEMTLSQTQVDEIIKNATAAYGASFATGDSSKVAAFYDPNAVLIKTSKDGSQGYFGREEIAKGLAPFVENPNPNAKLEHHPGFVTANSEYLIQRGAFEVNGSMAAFELIWKKQADGSYLIVRDEFKLP